MSCNHVNPAGYVFCGTCGGALDHARCRCGFVAVAGDVFCGRCGANLAEVAAGVGQSAVNADHRLDLERLMKQAAQEKHLESTQKARVTQDDIRKLLTKRRKKF